MPCLVMPPAVHGSHFPSDEETSVTSLGNILAIPESDHEFVSYLGILIDTKALFAGSLRKVKTG